MRTSRVSVTLALVATVATGCWLQLGGDARRRGFQPSESTLSPANVAGLVEAWSAVLPSPASAPVVNGNRVFVASGSRMTALHAATGAQLWQDVFEEDGQGLLLLDPAIIGGQLIAPYVFFSFGGAISFDQATGASQVSTPSDDIPLGASAVRGSLVATSVGAFAPGLALHALAYAGKTGFIAFGSGSLPPTSPPMILGDHVYVSHGDTMLAYGLDVCPSGPAQGFCFPVWATELAADAGMPVALSGTTVAVPLADGNVAVLDALTGALQWTAVTGSTGARPPAVDDGGTFYVGTADGRVRAFAVAGCGGATCAPSWTSAAGDGAVAAQPVVANGVVYVGSAAGSLYAYDAAGCAGECAALRTLTVDADATRVTPVVANGALFATTNTGVVAAYRLPSGQ